MEFKALQQTSLWGALSDIGREIETPKGIFYWSTRARQEAEIDGTIGIAQDDDGTISHLKIAEPWAGENIMKRAPKGKIFGYAPIEGLATLRTKWLARMTHEYPNLAGNASLPVVTNGITHSLAISARLLLNPGQTLVTADKSWENYEHIFSDVQRLKVAPFPLFTGHNDLNLDALIGTCREVAHHQGKVVLLLNFPHNQTGFMPTAQQCRALGSRIKELCASIPHIPFTVLLDDAYEGYIYEKAALHSSPLPFLWNDMPNFAAGKLDGISKVMLAYGYRVGFLTFFANGLDRKPFSEEFSKIYREEVGTKIGGFVRGEISQVGHHGQVLADALMDSLPRVDAERAEVIGRLGERHAAMMRELEEGYKKYGRDELWADPCNAGFFCYVNLSAKHDPKKIAERLLTEKKVGVVPSGQGLRLAFAGVSKEKIPRMIRALFEVVFGE